MRIFANQAAIGFAAGLAVFALFGLNAGTAAAGVSLGAAAMRGAAPERPLLLPVFFHHRKQEDELYCVDRVYWWFYRPYKTADENYARCMPYFHYLSEDTYGGPAAPPSSNLK
jgi:hypothetical protein